ncbi:alkaline phosphatase-like protein, partial [Caulochytrium protostelioides]
MIPRIWRHGIWLLLILALHVMSLSVFSTGFLLMRRELSLFSTTNEGWRPRRWKKAVFIVIDALRYDFTLHDATKDPDTTPYYLNKLPVFDEMLRTRPDHSLRIQVRADPPTTTMQRIKGVTTGGLPTFIDAGSNFGGALITEDNIVWQAINAGRNVTFMGDDTWESLFPNTFNTSYPYPSLVVYDLHTVDNGVASHLYPALTEDTSSSWDVLIAHFLGVDHAGHRYGPEHPEMALKLTQMNDWIKRVFQEMDDDTIVFLMGDHGMDAKGDHGGDSENELNAGFFAYSKSRPLSDLPQDQRESLMTQIRERLKAIPLGSDAPLVELKGERTLPQIDFVPSFCLLTGLPVPFGNLGSLIPELFLHGATPHDALNELLHAAQLNARQIYH